MVSSGIPRWEQGVYFSVWVSLAARAFYAVYVASNDYQFIVRNDLDTGWRIINRSKDTSDSEWALCCSVMQNGFLWLLMGHVFIGQISRWYHFENRDLMFLVYDLLALVYTIGFRAVSAVFVEAAVLYSMACFTASELIVWITSGAILLMMQFTLTHMWLEKLGILSAAEPMLIEYGLAMALLRCTSIALTRCADAGTCESCRRSISSGDCLRETPCCGCGTSSSLRSALCYLTYLPLFFSGPLMPFDKFCNQLKRPMQRWNSQRVSAIACLIARVTFWIAVFEVTIHYFYFSALFMKVSFMAHTTLWTAAGVSYLHGQYFMVKYFVIFGGAGAMAMLDQLSPPGPPSCISRMYRYSSMWRLGLMCFF